MVTTKTKGVIVAASAAVGTSGRPGYLHAIVCMVSGGAATINVYDGTSTAGTEVMRITAANVAGDCNLVSGLNIYCSSGIYVAVTNAVAAIEYSGCV